MTTRIGLFTPRKRRKKGQTSTETTYVEVATAADLAAKVTSLGAKRVGLMSRDRAGETKVEGEMFSPTALTEKHLTWINGKSPEFETRGLFFD